MGEPKLTGESGDAATVCLLAGYAETLPRTGFVVKLGLPETVPNVISMAPNFSWRKSLSRDVRAARR